MTKAKIFRSFFMKCSKNDDFLITFSFKNYFHRLSWLVRELPDYNFRFRRCYGDRNFESLGDMF